MVIDGDAFVVKHVDRAYDWIARQTGDLACWPIVVWERGLVDLAPDCIDHTIVGAARTATGGALLMRDVSAWLVPADDTPLSLEQHLRFLDHLAAFHAACWGWEDTIGLWPLGNRYALFGPEALACEAALGHPEPVTRIAEAAWVRLGEVAPRNGGRARTAAERAVAAASTRSPAGRTRSSTATGSSATWVAAPTAAPCSSTGRCPGSGPPVVELAHYLALNSARLPVGHTKDDAIAAYRASLERHGIDTEPWFDRQLALCLLGVMLQLGWEKSFDERRDELAWWAARVEAGVRHLR